jgi:hypothetical protein
MSMTDTPARPRRGQQSEKRDVAFFIRAKTGPGPRDWSPCGAAFARKNGQEGFVLKLNTLPLPNSGWNGLLVMVPPFVQDDEPIEE